MKFFENNDEAVIEYHSGDFKVIKRGSYVTCAVSGARIPVDQLQYWNPDKQEAYASYDEAAKALGLELYSSEKQ